MRQSIAFIMLLSALLFPASGFTELVSPAPGRVAQVVIVWLKDHGNQTARNRYIEGTKALSKLPMVQSYRVGTVLPGGRNIVDSSYDLAIVATFKNRRKFDEYLKHPDHDKIIAEKLKPLVDKIIVYDFVETK